MHALLDRDLRGGGIELWVGQFVCLETYQRQFSWELRPWDDSLDAKVTWMESPKLCTWKPSESRSAGKLHCVTTLTGPCTAWRHLYQQAMRSAGSRLVHPGILQNHDYCRPLVNESEAVFSSYHMSSSIYPTNLYHLGYCQKAATNEHCPEPEDEADSEFLMCRSSVKVNEPNIPTCNTSYFSFFYLFSLFLKKISP